MNPPPNINTGDEASGANMTDTARHERCAQDEYDEARQLPMNDGANGAQFGRLDCWSRALPERRSPRKELPGGIDREQPDEREQRQLCNERNAMEVVRGALLEEEHAEEAHNQNCACGSAEYRVRQQNGSRIPDRQLASDQDEFNR